MYNRIIKVCIYVLTFLLPLFWLPFSFEVFEFNKQYLLFFLVSLAFLAWIAKMVLVDKELRFKRSPLDIFVLAFLFITVLSAIFSVDKSSSIFGFYGRFSDGLIGLLSLGLLYFLITNNVYIKKTEEKEKAKLSESRPPTVEGLIKVFIWSVFFIILISYLSIFGVFAKMSAKFSLPAIMSQSTFNPAAGSLEGLSVFLAMVLVFLIGRILVSEREGKKRGRLTINYLLLILTLGLLAMIDFTPAWITVMASLILFLAVVLGRRVFRQDVNKLLLPIIIAIVAGVLLFVDTSGLQSWLFKFQLPREQILDQSQSWQIALKGATENVKAGFLGSGIGTWSYDFSKFKPIEFNQSWLWQIRFDRAGSAIAEILGNLGFLGIISYLALIGIFILISYFFLTQNRSGIPLLIAFLALFISQFVYYQNTILAFSFWLILALSVVNWQKPVKEKVISFKDFPELSLVFSAVLIVFCLLLLGLYFFAGKFYLADIKYGAAAAGQTQNLEKAVNLNPYQPQYKIVLARDYLTKLLAETQKPADERNQDNLSLYTHRAITYAKGGQIGKNNIKGAVELSPNRVAAWETLAMIYRDIQGLAQGSLEWGIKSFEKAVSLEPTNPVLHTELAKLYLISNDKEKASGEFNRARELKPDYLDAAIQLALMQERENNLEEAVKQMENLATAFPYNTEVMFQLGRLYFNSNRVSDAINQFEAVIILAPNHSNAHYSLGVAYQKKGQIQKAIGEFEKVLELNPDNADVGTKLEELRK